MIIWNFLFDFNPILSFLSLNLLFELSWISSVQEFLIISLHSVVCTTFASHVLDFSPFMGFRRAIPFVTFRHDYLG